MKKKNEMITFTIKLALFYYAVSVVLILIISKFVNGDVYSILNIQSFFVGSFIILSNFILGAYDLNFFINKNKKNIYMVRSIVRYILLFIIVYVIQYRYNLNVIVVAFEIMAFQLAVIFVNMFGLSGLLLEKE